MAKVINLNMLPKVINLNNINLNMLPLGLTLGCKGLMDIIMKKKNSFST